MKHLFILLILASILVSCGDKNSDPTVGNKNLWTKLADFPGGPREGMYSFSLNGKGYAGGGYYSPVPPNTTYYNDLWEYNSETDQWTKKKDMPFPVMTEQSFTINNKAYLLNFGIGFLEYDPSTDTWTSKATFHDYRSGHRGFALNGKIYVGYGYNNGNPTELFNDLWMYDPTTNAWTQKANPPFAARSYAVGWSSSGKGYFGFGNGPAAFQTFNDFWEYDAATDKWTAKSAAGVTSFGFISSFTLNDKPFLIHQATGADNLMFLLAYDGSADNWKPKASFTSEINSGMTLFSIDKTAYVVGGWKNGVYSKQVWKYEY
jgi:N-acetylneuraminic acid mutarotase